MKTDNGLIGKFMGGEFLRKQDTFIPGKFNESYIFNGHPGNWRVENTIKCHFMIHELSYHLDWEWLMPVLIKIESLRTDKFYVITNIVNNTISIDAKGHSSGMIYFHVDERDNIKLKFENIYTSVVKFIGWYHQHIEEND